MEKPRRQESNFVTPLLDAIKARGFEPETCAMDKGSDNTRVHAECDERGVDPFIPIRGVKGKQPVLPIGIGARLFPRIPRHSRESATSTAAAPPQSACSGA